MLHLQLPTDENDLIEHLRKRGEAHFREKKGRRILKKTNNDVLKDAARQLVSDRQFAEQQQLAPLPGQAEYLDLVRAVVELQPEDPDEQQRILESTARFTLQKHPEMLNQPRQANP